MAVAPSFEIEPIRVTLTRLRGKTLPSPDEKPRGWGYVVTNHSLNERSVYLATPFDDNYILLEAMLDESGNIIRKGGDVNLVGLAHIANPGEADDILYESALEGALYTSKFGYIADETTGVEIFNPIQSLTPGKQEVDMLEAMRKPRS